MNRRMICTAVASGAACAAPGLWLRVRSVLGRPRVALGVGPGGGRRLPAGPHDGAGETAAGGLIARGLAGTAAALGDRLAGEPAVGGVIRGLLGHDGLPYGLRGLL